MKNSTYILSIIFMATGHFPVRSMHTTFRRSASCIKNIQQRSTHNCAWSIMLSNEARSDFKSWHYNKLDFDPNSSCFILHHGKNKKIRQDLIAYKKDLKVSKLNEPYKKSLEDIYFANEESTPWHKNPSTLALRMAFVQQLCGKIYPGLTSFTKDLGSFFHEPDDEEGTNFATTGVSAFLCSRKPSVEQREESNVYHKNWHSSILVDRQVSLPQLVESIYTLQLKHHRKIRDNVWKLRNTTRYQTLTNIVLHSTDNFILSEIYRLEKQRDELLCTLDRKPNHTVVWGLPETDDRQLKHNFESNALLAAMQEGR